MTPIKLHLFASVLCFILFAMATSHVFTPAEDTSSLMKQLDAPDHAGLPAFLVPHVKHLVGNPAGFGNALVDVGSKASMLLIPVHALFLKLAYLGSRRFYGEHVIFSLHAHALAFLASVPPVILGIFHFDKTSDAINEIALVAITVYLILAARRTYGGTVFGATWRMLVVGIA